MFFVAPISTRKQDHRVTALIKKGTTTTDEIFEAQFGEWPAKGLNKDTACDAPVHFKPYGHGPRNMMMAPFTMGYTDPNANNRTIYLNRFTLSPMSPVSGLLTSRMAYARAHDILEPLLGIEFTRQLAIGLIAVSLCSSYRYAIASSFAKVAMPSVSDIVGEELIHLEQINDGPLGITARRAFLNDAQNIIENRPFWQKTKTNGLQAIDSILTLMPRQHYAQDHELQARLHNVMVRGYKRWKKIPATQDELYAALWDMGIKRPAEINTYMNDPDQKPLRKVFGAHSQQTGYVAAPSAEMNIGLNYFRSNEVLKRFWRDYLPVMYGDLLVKYGDSNGFEKMGYDGNDRDIFGMPTPLPAPTPPGP